MLAATERKALALSAFTAACIAFAPGEVMTGLLLLVVSGLLWRWDQRVTRAEAALAAASAPPPAGPAPPGDAGDAPPPAVAA
jgi:hypothetical protein